MSTTRIGVPTACAVEPLRLRPLLALRCDVRNTIEELQNRMTTLREEAQGVQARADAEARQLTAEESAKLTELCDAFDATDAEIARRERLAALDERLAAPAPRITRDPVEEPAAAAVRAPARPVARLPAGSIRDLAPKGSWGWRSFGEFASSVSRHRGGLDPRLVANGPSTYGQEGMGEDGGFAVPPDFRAEIMLKVMGEESILGRTDQQVSSSNQITIPKDETTPWQTTGGIQAYWESEGNQLAVSKPELQSATVRLNKLTALVPVTGELLEDANSLSNYLRRKAPEKMDFKVNDAIISGTGSGQPQGILTSTALVTVAEEGSQTAATVNFQNVTKMWNRLYSGARRRAVWLMNQDVEQQLQAMAFPGSGSNSIAVPVYMPPGGLSQSPYATLLGRECIITEACAPLGTVGDLVLADLSSYLSVTKVGGVRQDVSIHLWFDYDMTAFRFILRVGGQPWWTTPIKRKASANTNTWSPFVALATRA